MARVVVLDVDGTLMDTNYLHTEAWARAFDWVGPRVQRARLHKQIGKGAGLLIQEFVDDEETAQKIQDFHSEVYEELLSRVNLSPIEHCCSSLLPSFAPPYRHSRESGNLLIIAWCGTATGVPYCFSC